MTFFHQWSFRRSRLRDTTFATCLALLNPCCSYFQSDVDGLRQRFICATLVTSLSTYPVWSMTFWHLDCQNSNCRSGLFYCYLYSSQRALRCAKTASNRHRLSWSFGLARLLGSQSTSIRCVSDGTPYDVGRPHYWSLGLARDPAEQLCAYSVSLSVSLSMKTLTTQAYRTFSWHPQAISGFKWLLDLILSRSLLWSEWSGSSSPRW